MLASIFGYKIDLNEIAEAERDMIYELQKNSFKKAVKSPILPNLNNNPSIIPEEMGVFEIPNYESKM